MPTDKDRRALEKDANRRVSDRRQKGSSYRQQQRTGNDSQQLENPTSIKAIVLPAKQDGNTKSEATPDSAPPGVNSNSSPSSPTFTSPQADADAAKNARPPPTEAPEEECSLFVGDLSRIVTEEMLRTAFSQYGEVVNVDIKRDKITRNTLGYGFIQFKKRSEAEQAFSLDGTEIGSRKIRIGWAQKNTNLFLGDLDDEVTTEMLRTIFETYGSIVKEETYVKKNKYGFVKFKYRAHAEKAKQELDGKPLHHPNGKVIGMGRPVRIGWGDANTQRNCVHVQFDASQAQGLSEDDFRESFKQYGKVIKVSLPRYADKRLKGYGFVHFEDNETGERSAARAITTLSGKEIKGVRIQCNFGKRQVASGDVPNRFQTNNGMNQNKEAGAQVSATDIMTLLNDPVYLGQLQKIMSQQAAAGPILNNPMMNPLGLGNSLSNLSLGNPYAGMNWLNNLAAYHSNLLNLQLLTQAAQAHALSPGEAVSPTGKAQPQVQLGNPNVANMGGVPTASAAGYHPNGGWLGYNAHAPVPPNGHGPVDRNDAAIAGMYPNDGRGMYGHQMGRQPAYPPQVPYGEQPYYPQDKSYHDGRHWVRGRGVSSGGYSGGTPTHGQAKGYPRSARRAYPPVQQPAPTGAPQHGVYPQMSDDMFPNEMTPTPPPGYLDFLDKGADQRTHPAARTPRSVSSSSIGAGQRVGGHNDRERSGGITRAHFRY